jgi:hypothetical protein
LRPDYAGLVMSLAPLSQLLMAGALTPEQTSQIIASTLERAE